MKGSKDMLAFQLFYHRLIMDKLICSNNFDQNAVRLENRHGLRLDYNVSLLEEDT